ncbi:MAG: hypothetical protein QXT66_07005 [Nitrososphaerota archaeon]
MFIKNKRIDTPDEVRSFENGNESRQMLASELTPSKSVHAGMNKEANGRGMLRGELD